MARSTCRCFEQRSSLLCRSVLSRPTSLHVPKSTIFIHPNACSVTLPTIYPSAVLEFSLCTKCLRPTSYALRHHEYLPRNIRAIATDCPWTLYVSPLNPFRETRCVITDSLRGLADEVVTILVGPEETPFRIHKGLLCSKSEYFRAAFEGSFRESTDKRIHLRDDDSKIFQFYAALIYIENAIFSWSEDFDLDVCCHLYVLADRLGSEGIQNIVIDIIHTHPDPEYSVDLNAEIINYVYENTMPGSFLRDILVDFAAYEIVPEEHPDLGNAIPEFLFAALSVCSKRLPRRLKDEKGRLDMDWCKAYHLHRDGSSCSPMLPESVSSLEIENRKFRRRWA